MKIARIVAAVTALLSLSVASALAQSGPHWPQGYVPSEAEWETMWESKQDYTACTAALNAAPGNSALFLNGACAWVAAGGGTGNVIGFGTSVVNNLATFSNTTASGINDSGLALANISTLSGNQTLTGNKIFTGTLNVTGTIEINGSPIALPWSPAVGGTGLSNPTAGVIYKSAGPTNPMTASALSDNGTLLSSGENFDLTAFALSREVPNAGTTGTSVNHLAKLTGAPSTVVITATTDTDNAIGIVIGGAGTTGSAIIARMGQATCTFDGATTAGHYVTISSTVAGDCHDTSANRPTGAEIIGQVLSTNASGGNYAVDMSLGFANTSSGAGVTWPASGSLIISNGTDTPASLVPSVNGDCAIIVSNAWTVGACPGGGGGGGNVSVSGAISVGNIATWAATNTLSPTGVSYGSSGNNILPITDGSGHLNPSVISALPLANLAQIADATLLANVSGVTGPPSQATLSAIIDHDIGNTANAMLYRGASAWALTPALASAVYVSNSSGVPAPSRTLPAGLTIPGYAASAATFTLGSTSIALATTVTSVSGLTLVAPTITGQLTAANMPTLGNGHLYLGNVSNQPVDSAVTAALDIIGNTQNALLARGASSWGIVPPANNAVVVTSSVGVPSESTTLPAGLTIPGYALSSSVPTAANPTATIGATATNGTSTSFARADAAPALSTTGVSPGSYTNLNATVDATGRITAASNGSGGTSYTPTYYAGTVTGTNTYTSTPTQTYSANTAYNVFCGQFANANTGGATLNLGGVGALAIRKQVAGALVALQSGEITGGGTDQCFQIDSSSTFWLLQSTRQSGITQLAANHIVTAVEWAAFQRFDVTGAGVTITLPQASTLATNGGISVKTVGQSAILAPTAASGDGINGGTANASASIATNTLTTVTTSGADTTSAFAAVLGLVAGANITLTNNGGATTIAVNGIADSTLNSISAAGTTQGAATALTNQLNNVTTAAGACPAGGPYTACNGVALNTATGVGNYQFVCAFGAANGVLVYPGTTGTGTIGSGAASVPARVTPNACNRFEKLTSGANGAWVVM